MLLTNKHIKIIIIILLFIWQHCLDTFLQYMLGNTVWNHIYQVTWSGNIFTVQYVLYLETLSGSIFIWQHCLEPYLPVSTVCYQPGNTVWNFPGNTVQNYILATRSGTICTWQLCLEPYLPGNTLEIYLPGNTVWNHIYLATLSGNILYFQHLETLSGTIFNWQQCQEPYLPGNTV